MGFTSLNATDLETGKRMTEGLWTNVKNNEDYLYSNIIDVSESGGVIRNGGFEIDTDVNGRPDNWDINLYTGGGSTLITTATTWAEPLHGSKSLCFTRPSGVGNGAGNALSEYFPLSTRTPVIADMILYADTSAVDNGVGIYLYDKNKTYTTYISPYRSTNESTAARRLVVAVNPSTASNAKFGRLMINCGGTAMGSSAHIYVDDVHGDVGLSGRTYDASDTSGPHVMYIQQNGYADKTSTYYTDEFVLELPYANQKMLIELSFGLLVRIDRVSTISTGLGTTASTVVLSSVLVPQLIGIALGNSTFKTDYCCISNESTYAYINFKSIIPLDGLSYAKKTLTAYLQLSKDSTIIKSAWPATYTISGPTNISYAIINAKP